MADIAILVAEEYERRVKNSRRASGFAQGDDQLEGELVSCVAVLARNLQKKFGHEKMEFVKWVKEPRSQVGLEASSGFFSA